MPYRDAPEPEVEPYLDLLPVYFRYAPIIGGWLAVRQTKLRFNPRLGRARTVPLLAGIDALRISRVLDPSSRFNLRGIDTASTISTWQHIAASPAYADTLARSANPNVLLKAFAVRSDTNRYRRRSFTPIIDGTQLVVIRAHGATIRRCFDLPDGIELPDDTGAMLGKALRWLRTGSLRRVLDLVWPHSDARRFSRDEVRAARVLAFDDGVYRVIGPSEDAIGLKLSEPETDLLDRWVRKR